jgi:hypothetical protein
MTTIEVGKFYNWDNDKMECVAIRGDCVAVAFQNQDGEWDATGVLIEEAMRDFKPWIDEPAIPWDSVPPWLKWWAVDKDGSQYYYESKPNQRSAEWVGKGGMVFIPQSHRIPYVGDWRSSLRQRPGKEVAK